MLQSAWDLAVDGMLPGILPGTSLRRRVQGREPAGPGIEPHTCDDCGMLTGRGWAGGEEYESKWFCGRCWAAWDTEADDEGGTPRQALLVKLWAASVDCLVISLGTWCGVKMAMRAVNMSGPTLPFDWIRVSLEGVLHILKTDFQDFLQYYFVTDDRHFIAPTHSFFHDNLFDERTEQTYMRRIDRFRRLRDRGGLTSLPTLFVYALASSLECLEAQVLLATLQDLFGANTYLLLLLDCQLADETIIFDESPRLILCTLSSSHAQSGNEYNIMEAPYVTAYHAPLLSVYRYVNGGPRPPHVVASLADLAQPSNSRLGFRQVCVGEDLSVSVASYPLLPSDESFRCALHESWAPRRELMWQACQAHFAVSNVQFSEESEERSRIAPCRWRTAFAASVCAKAMRSATGSTCRRLYIRPGTNLPSDGNISCPTVWTRID